MVWCGVVWNVCVCVCVVCVEEGEGVSFLLRCVGF